MKLVLLFSILVLSASSFAQQTETFDLATYVAPAGWSKSSDTKNVIGFSTTNKQARTYCQMGIYASTNSKGNSLTDFESEWQILVAQTYKPSITPEPVSTPLANGWTEQRGVATFQFDGAESAAMLVTMTGYERCMSFLILTNTQDYFPEIEKFLGSVQLKKMDAPAPPIAIATAPAILGNSNTTHSVIGTWVANASDNSNYRMKNGVMNVITRQYTFMENGTYTFLTKTYDPLVENLLLTKENGTYMVVNGTSVAVVPQKSVIEAWTKKNNTDNWGTFINTQNKPLEKTTYQFTRHYFSGIQQWNLVLQSDKATQRDGPFSSNDTFANAWYYNMPSASYSVIVLPGK